MKREINGKQSPLNCFSVYMYMYNCYSVYYVYIYIIIIIIYYHFSAHLCSVLFQT